MAKKITQKEVAVIAILVAIIVLVATFGSQGPSTITGAISGKANVTIQSLLSINFVTNQDVVTFGAGRVESTCNNATLATNDTSQDPTSCWTGTFAYNTTTNAFEIENDGNRAANVTVNGTDAATFIGGSTVTPVFQFHGVESEANSCDAGLQTTWTTIDATPRVLCDDFNHQLPKDQLYTHIKVIIPDDATVGTHNATVEFTAALA